jgi:hypothetical protein
MGLNLSFFKTPKHRVFNYQPLYYDERKEELQERVARAEEAAEKEKREKMGLPQKKKKDDPDYVPGRTIRHNFRRSVYSSRRRPGSPFLMRIIVLLSMIVLIVALFYVAQAFGLLFV